MSPDETSARIPPTMICIAEFIYTLLGLTSLLSFPNITGV